MTMDTGITGAKRQSWAHDNPRDLLRQLVEQNPTWSREHVFKEFKAKIIKNRSFIDVVLEYWFANNFHSLVRDPGGRPTHGQQGAAASGAKAKIQARIKQEAQVLLLDLMMPIGKKLGDCTGLECKALSTKMGGWLLRISNQIKPDETVSSALSENQVRDLYAKTTA